MNNLDLTELEQTARESIEIAERATAGPWDTVPYELGPQQLMLIRSNSLMYPDNACKDPGMNNVCYMAANYGPDAKEGLRCHQMKEDNAAFIAHARTAVPDLAQAVIELVKRVRVAEEALTRMAFRKCVACEANDTCFKLTCEDEDFYHFCEAYHYAIAETTIEQEGAGDE